MRGRLPIIGQKKLLIKELCMAEKSNDKFIETTNRFVAREMQGCIGDYLLLGRMTDEEKEGYRERLSDILHSKDNDYGEREIVEEAKYTALAYGKPSGIVALVGMIDAYEDKARDTDKLKEHHIIAIDSLPQISKGAYILLTLIADRLVNEVEGLYTKETVDRQNNVRHVPYKPVYIEDVTEKIINVNEWTPIEEGANSYDELWRIYEKKVGNVSKKIGSTYLNMFLSEIAKAYVEICDKAVAPMIEHKAEGVYTASALRRYKIFKKMHKDGKAICCAKRKYAFAENYDDGEYIISDIWESDDTIKIKLRGNQGSDVTYDLNSFLTDFESFTVFERKSESKERVYLS